MNELTVLQQAGHASRRQIKIKNCAQSIASTEQAEMEKPLQTEGCPQRAHSQDAGAGISFPALIADPAPLTKTKSQAAAASSLTYFWTRFVYSYTVMNREILQARINVQTEIVIALLKSKNCFPRRKQFKRCNWKSMNVENSS